MQTFVLVPQTNKKYYVHNDIFRYQDDDLGQEMPGDPEYSGLKFCCLDDNSMRIFGAVWMYIIVTLSFCLIGSIGY